jgi:tetratricopeptide (TPR) repeat protein
VGKTALAVHWAHRVRDRFPDGQLYVNLHGYSTVAPADPADVLGGFLRALGVPAERVPADAAAAAAMFRDQLADRRVLLVCDNAATAEQVRPLLPDAAGCLALVTSRQTLPALAAVPVTLDGWYHALLGDHQQALTDCRQALTMFQNLGNRQHQAHTWDSLGYAHQHLGQHTEAVACYRQAFTLLRELGDRYKEATTLTHLGDAHHAASDPAAAHDAYHQAMTILDDLDHPDADTVRAKLTM